MVRIVRQTGLLVAMLLINSWTPGAGAALAAVNDAPVTDERIERAVEREIWTSDAMESHLVDVDVADGVVTLSGTVDNLFAKERSAQRAQLVKGVRAVVNKVDVDVDPIKDSTIRSGIEDAIRTDPATEAFEISPVVQNGHVILRGTVESWAEKELAGAIAKSVKGVERLDNKIDVQPEFDRPDAELRQEIEQRLRWDASVDHALISVGVNNGHVTLEGTVGSAAEKARAISDAYVNGVTFVEATDLGVEFWARDERLRANKYEAVADDAITEAVQDAFRFDPRIQSAGLQVNADDGIVTLSGTVPNLRAKRVAEQTASNVVGVWRVKNHLRVRPIRVRPDENIRADINNKLYQDTLVNDLLINITVRNGKATLHGEVGSGFTKLRAGDIAASVPGVVTVENGLIVPTTDALEIKHDWEIRQDIESELFWSPFVDSDDVNVEVDDGVATLTGTVESTIERRAAEDNAIEGGAVAVDNDLELRDYNATMTEPLDS